MEVFVEYSEFKGNKMIVLKRNQQDKYPFQFGLAKAKLLIDGLQEVKAFIASCEGKATQADDIPF